MYHWSVVIPWSHLLSSFQTLTDSMDGPTPNPETYSHPEGGVSEAGWSQNKAQKSGALSTHGIYVRNMGGGQCIRVISWSHPISSLQMLKETQQMVLLEDQNTIPTLKEDSEDMTGAKSHPDNQVLWAPKCGCQICLCHWSDAISCPQLISSVKTLTITIDDSTWILEHHSNPEGGDQGYGWSQSTETRQVLWLHTAWMVDVCVTIVWCYIDIDNGCPCSNIGTWLSSWRRCSRIRQ